MCQCRDAASPHQINEAVQLYEAGWSLARISERMEVDPTTVLTRLRDRRVRMRDTHGYVNGRNLAIHSAAYGEVRQLVLRVHHHHNSDVTKHTPQDGLLQLEELIHADLHKYIDPASRAAQVGWGVFFTVVHQIRAVLTLHRNRVCFSAGPNRRTVVEYILFLAWLTDDGESAVDVLNRSLQNEQKLMATRLSGASFLDQFPERARQVLAETIATPLAPHPDERLLKPWHLIEEYDSTLKSYYAAESRFSHVSLTCIQFFLKDEGEAIGLSQMPVPEEPISCPGFCLHALSQALLIFNELLVGRPWTAELARIAEDYGLDTRRPTRK